MKIVINSISLNENDPEDAAILHGTGKKTSIRSRGLKQWVNDLINDTEKVCHRWTTSIVEAGNASRCVFTDKRLNWQKTFGFRSYIAVGIHNMGYEAYVRAVYQKLSIPLSILTAAHLQTKTKYIQQERTRRSDPVYKKITKQQRTEKRARHKRKAVDTYKNTPAEINVGTPSVIPAETSIRLPKKRRISRNSHPHLYIFEIDGQKYTNVELFRKQLKNKGHPFDKSTYPPFEQFKKWYNDSSKRQTNRVNQIDLDVYEKTLHDLQ